MKNLLEPPKENEKGVNKKKDFEESTSDNTPNQEDYMLGTIVFADNPPPYVLRIPFSQRVRQKKNDEKLSKFLDMLKNLHINISFVETLELVPKYAKFMKEILARKMKF